MSSENKIDIALTAEMIGTNRIDISGPPGPFPLARDTGAWLFNFTLNDTTGRGVRFTTLDAEDGSNSCPPGASGNHSRLIVGEHVGPDPTKARFTDNNNNRAADGVVNVTFQWHFDCRNNEGITHIGTYDPVVPNGGNT